MQPQQINQERWKLILLLFAAIIAAASLIYTNYLVKNLAVSERTKAEVWAMSTKSIMTMPDVDDEFITFVYSVRDSLNLPAIIVNQKDSIVLTRNLDSTKTNFQEAAKLNPNVHYDPDYFQQKLKEMKRRHSPIMLDIGNDQKWFVYYEDSWFLRQLRVFPYIQLSLIAIFLVIAYTVFNSVRKSEQNMVWVGLTKEAAHQLGTPISSLMGWLELVKIKFDKENDETLNEMENDIKRLEIVADRFSKIGSTPILTPANVYQVVEAYVDYFKIRTSNKISFQLTGDKEVYALLNIPLFDWIIENLLKNAVNAIESEGKIGINIVKNFGKEEIFLDISDSGKGISRSNFETIFKPGFTTRQRGWGLGLSLTKRMVHYHKGLIYVKESEIGKGTTFRIVLKSIQHDEAPQI